MKLESVSRAAGRGGAQGLVFALQKGTDAGAHQMKTPGKANYCAPLWRNLSAVCSLISICLQSDCRQKNICESMSYERFPGCLQCLQCFYALNQKSRRVLHRFSPRSAAAGSSLGCVLASLFGAKS
jgi:hypothetical protein